MIEVVQNLDWGLLSIWDKTKYVVANYTGFWEANLAKIRNIVNTAIYVKGLRRTYWLEELMNTFVNFANKYPKIGKTTEYQTHCDAVIKAANDYDDILNRCENVFSKMELNFASRYVNSTWSDFLNAVSLGFKRY